MNTSALVELMASTTGLSSEICEQLLSTILHMLPAYGNIIEYVGIVLKELFMSNEEHSLNIKSIFGLILNFFQSPFDLLVKVYEKLFHLNTNENCFHEPTWDNEECIDTPVDHENGCNTECIESKVIPIKPVTKKSIKQSHPLRTVNGCNTCVSKPDLNFQTSNNTQTYKTIGPKWCLPTRYIRPYTPILEWEKKKGIKPCFEWTDHSVPEKSSESEITDCDCDCYKRPQRCGVISVNLSSNAIWPTAHNPRVISCQENACCPSLNLKEWSCPTKPNCCAPVPWTVNYTKPIASYSPTTIHSGIW
jgi:hypothetical protein